VGPHGTSPLNTVLLQRLAAQVRAELPSVADPRDLLAAFLLVEDWGRLGQLPGASKTRAARYRPRRNAPHSTAFDVNGGSLRRRLCGIRIRPRRCRAWPGPLLRLPVRP
jgi:hypothetical protein